MVKVWLRLGIGMVKVNVRKWRTFQGSPQALLPLGEFCQEQFGVQTAHPVRGQRTAHTSATVVLRHTPPTHKLVYHLATYCRCPHELGREMATLTGWGGERETLRD